MDLRNAQIVIRWCARDLQLSAEAQPALWFHSRVPASGPQGPRYVNYIFVSHSSPQLKRAVGKRTRSC